MRKICTCNSFQLNSITNYESPLMFIVIHTILPGLELFLIEQFLILLRQRFYHTVAFHRFSTIPKVQCHMRIPVIYFNPISVRTVAAYYVAWHVNDTVNLNDRLLICLETVKLLKLLRVQFFGISSDEQWGNVVIVGRRFESLLKVAHVADYLFC